MEDPPIPPVIPQQAPGNGNPRLRPIGAFDEPNAREVAMGIPTPSIVANNFEIKSSLITMVQNQRYNGLSLEDPLDHLDQFERLCRTVKMNGVPEESIKMILFPFSLGNKASQWEKNIPSELVSTWDQVKKEFLTKFFPKQKTAKLRNDITSFKQGGQESLYDAWERLKGYTRSCPHHNVSKENLLGIFHRGVVESYRRALDTASNGSFANLNVTQAEQLIENLAQSDACYGGDYDRELRDTSSQDLKLKEITEKLDKMSKAFLISQKAVNFVGEYEGCQQGYQQRNQEMGVGIDGNEIVQEEVHYLGNQGGYQGNGYNQNFQQRPYVNFQPKNQYNNTTLPSFPTQTYPPRPQYSNQANPSTQLSNQNSTDDLLKQLLEGQNKGYMEIGNRIDGVATTIEGLKSRMNVMDSKMDGMYSDLDGKINSLASHMKTIDLKVAQASSSSITQGGALPAKTQPNPKAFCNAILTSVENDHEKDVEEISNLLYGVNGEDLVSQSEAKDPKRAEKENAPKDELRSYEPPVPFPQRILTKAKKKIFSSFKAKMSTIGAPLPPMTSLLEVPLHFEFILNILANREKVEEIMEALMPQTSTPAETKTLPKLKDPGTFIISCSLGDLKIDNALCDSGASVNVMSLDMMEYLELKDIKKYSSSITYADASSKPPLGVIEDYPLKVGDCLIPTDFLVVDRGKPDKLPLILGTPFLNTAGASIDFPNKRVTLINVNPKVSYPIKPSSQIFCGTITHEEAQVRSVKTVDVEVLDGGCLELLFEEPMEEKVMEKPPKDTHPPTLVNSPLVPSMTLRPLRYIDGAVEYKVKTKERSNPFASVKAILTPEFIDKGPKGIEELMRTVLTLTFKDTHRSSSTPLSPFPKVHD